MKDIKALFVSEEGRKLSRKEVYIKNGDKVRRGPWGGRLGLTLSRASSAHHALPPYRETAVREML